MTEQLFNEIVQWQTETFPKSNAISKVHHLVEEVQELLESLTDKKFTYREMEMEFADCFLLLIGAAASAGLDYEEVVEIIQDKLAINRTRKWGTPDENGVVNSIKD